MKKMIFTLFLLVMAMSLPCYGMERSQDADNGDAGSYPLLVDLGNSDSHDESDDDGGDTAEFPDEGDSDDELYSKLCVSSAACEFPTVGDDHYGYDDRCSKLCGSGAACEFPTIGDDYDSDGGCDQNCTDDMEALRRQLNPLDLATQTPMTMNCDVEELSLPAAVSSLSAAAQSDWLAECKKLQSSSPEPIEENTLFLPAGTGTLPEDIKKSAEMLRSALITANERLRSYEGIVDVTGRTAVVGDLHGDFGTCKIIIDNFHRSFEAGTLENVVFLGDIMDRGDSSALTLLEVLSFFNKYPGRVYIIRGNHETRDMFTRHDARENPARADKHFEYIDKELLFQFFDSLPYAARINNTTLAVHGGIPSQGGRKIFVCGVKRPETSLGFDWGISEVMWSDYFTSFDSDEAVPYIGRNTARGGNTLCFNEAAAKEFLESMGLQYMIRAHQPDLGTFHQSPNKIITTVFSALENQGSAVGRQGAKVAIVDFSGAPKCFAKILPY